MAIFSLVCLQFALASLMLLAVSAQDTSINEMKNAFLDANIEEDLNINFDPSVFLQVALPQDDGTRVLVKAGVELYANQTSHIPLYNITCEGACSVEDTTGPFVVISVDPDAPPAVSQFRHFLGSDFNIQYDTTLKSSRRPYGEWFPPAPVPPEAHRYIFLLYRQPLGFNDNSEATSTPLTGMDVSSYAQKVGLGDPVGGTFMTVKLV